MLDHQVYLQEVYEVRECYFDTNKLAINKEITEILHEHASPKDSADVYVMASDGTIIKSSPTVKII